MHLTTLFEGQHCAGMLNATAGSARTHMRLFAVAPCAAVTAKT